MKKIILCLISIILYTTSSFSQENQSVEKKHYTYCMVYLHDAELVLGLSENYWLEKEPRLRNAKGKLVKFREFIDAMNYMEALGWEVMQIYPDNRGFSISSDGNMEELSISRAGYRVKLFRKEVTKEELEQIGAAIQQRL
ncbi:hypothetical protein [Dysgonomonas sp. HGC4]|uniref:hypothetical protein n=1 Tax=Dysgonomonas sp. HGC4 TaxID=1658009 RepID=UPI000681E028|nr:hypothetical protein [Dysgonomonas sp. HGC4]MBD8346983.1 hypothetical protein [Dysgonomonas sp. HGC4]